MNLTLSQGPESVSLPHPVSQQERMILLDVIRGVAICGILLMNIPYFGMSVWAGDPRVSNELGQATNMRTWFVINFLLEGSMRGLFSVLFGAGAMLFISRAEKAHGGTKAVELYVRRLIWLLLFGLINGYVLNWPGDILYHYAIMGLFLIPFRQAPLKIIGGIIVFFLAVTMFQSWLKAHHRNTMRDRGLIAEKMEKGKQKLSDEQKEDLEKWKAYQEESKVESMRKLSDKETKAVATGNYAKVWENRSRWTTLLETTKFHGGMVFDIIIFLLLGIVLFRTGILTGMKPEKYYWGLMILGYIVGLGWGYLEKNAMLQAQFDPFRFEEESIFPVNLYQIHRVGTTLGHMSLIILMWKNGLFKWLLIPLSKMGQMAFSNYLGQSIICGFFFYGYGFGNFGKLQRFELYYVVFFIWVFQMAFSVVWLRFFRFGPFEWLWRSLTYWEWQPMKK